MILLCKITPPLSKVWSSRLAVGPPQRFDTRGLDWLKQLPRNHAWAPRADSNKTPGDYWLVMFARVGGHPASKVGTSCSHGNSICIDCTEGHYQTPQEYFRGGGTCDVDKETRSKRPPTISIAVLRTPIAEDKSLASLVPENDVDRATTHSRRHRRY